MFKLIAEEFTMEKPDKFYKLNQMYMSAVKDITEKMMKTAIMNEVKLGKGEAFLVKMNNYIETQKVELKKQTAKKHNNGYMFITINPKPAVKLEDFRKLLKKISKKTCFEKCMYVLEQRGNNEENMGKGFHAHILVKRNLKYKPIKLKQNVKASCKNIVGNIHNDNQLNIQTIGEEFAKDKQQYIIGDKTGDGKSEKQNIDEKWRKTIGIEKYLGNIIFE
jgi:hypothetical protein